MRAIGYQTPGPITAEASLVDIDLPTPVPAGRDLLVEVQAVSVNPVDTKVRKGVAPDAGGWKVLGWDAVGRVAATGPDTTTGFAVGDEVFYAGSLIRPGTNSEFHLVDERIVGRKPASLSAAEAAALPLTAITAWEMLFERLAACLAAAKELGIEAAVAVTDATGSLRAFERADGAPFLTTDVATDKAWTASSYGYPTHVWNQYVGDPKVAPLAYHPRLLAVGGGYPIMEDGRLIGGVGISGGNAAEDQNAAEKGLEALGFELPA